MALILSIVALTISIASMAVSFAVWRMMKEINPRLDTIINSLDSLHTKIESSLATENQITEKIDG